jgi:hypothetical protein
MILEVDVLPRPEARIGELPSGVVDMAQFGK